MSTKKVQIRACIMAADRSLARHYFFSSFARYLLLIPKLTLNNLRKIFSLQASAYGALICKILRLLGSTNQAIIVERE